MRGEEFRRSTLNGPAKSVPGEGKEGEGEGGRGRRWGWRRGRGQGLRLMTLREEMDTETGLNDDNNVLREKPRILGGGFLIVLRWFCDPNRYTCRFGGHLDFENQNSLRRDMNMEQITSGKK